LVSFLATAFAGLTALAVVLLVTFLVTTEEDLLLAAAFFSHASFLFTIGMFEVENKQNS
jgi:hypothetical protein